MMPRVGDEAPEFTLPDDEGRNVAFADLRGRRVVLFFYPKDDTPGCTTEVCGIRDAYSRFASLDAVVLGVSPDSVESHRKFRAKYGLPFRLLADVEHEVCERYGVWVEKTMYGRTYMGVARTTFLIDEDGTIQRIFEKVSPADHPAQLLEALGAGA